MMMRWMCSGSMASAVSWGVLATGLFATTAVNPAGANGLFFGNPGQLWIQLIGVGATICLAGIGSFILLKVVSLFTRLRVERRGREHRPRHADPRRARLRSCLIIER